MSVTELNKETDTFERTDSSRRNNDIGFLKEIFDSHKHVCDNDSFNKLCALSNQSNKIMECKDFTSSESNYLGCFTNKKIEVVDESFTSNTKLSNSMFSFYRFPTRRLGWCGNNSDKFLNKPLVQFLKNLSANSSYIPPSYNLSVEQIIKDGTRMNLIYAVPANRNRVLQTDTYEEEFYEIGPNFEKKKQKWYSHLIESDVESSNNPTKCTSSKCIHSLGYDHEQIKHTIRGQSETNMLAEFLQEGAPDSILNRFSIKFNSNVNDVRNVSTAHLESRKVLFDSSVLYTRYRC